MSVEDDELSQEEIEENNKAIFQFQGALVGIMKPLKKYGQEDYVLMAISEIISLAYQLHVKLHGADVPFALSEHMKYMLEEEENDG